MEDLKKIALEILDKYKESYEEVIWERSGNFDKDLKELQKELDYYKALIEDF